MFSHISYPFGIKTFDPLIGVLISTIFARKRISEYQLEKSERGLSRGIIYSHM